MPPRNLLRMFLALWAVTAGVLLSGSLLTIRDAWLTGAHGNPHLLVLGAIEAGAAVLFLVPRTFRLGAIGLLLTVGIALLVHALLGRFRGDLLVYAVAVLFVRVHGPLTPAQWRAAFGR